jgi:PAS domain S-box-containing protein
MTKRTNEPAKPAASSASEHNSGQMNLTEDAAARLRSAKNSWTADFDPETGTIEEKILTSSFTGIYIYDLLAGANVFINPQYTRLTGYTLTDLKALKGAAFLALFHPQDQSRVTSHLEQIGLAGDGETREIEYRFKTADGRWIWCLSRDTVFERDRQGAVQRIIGTVVDIRERKHFETSLRESQLQAERRLAELQAIYDAAPIGLCVFDRRCRYLRINDHLAEINGIPASEHIGRTIREVVPDLADEAEKIFNRVLERGQTVLDIELSGTTPAQPGVQRTWNEHWLPLKDPAGQVIGVAVTAEETTQRKRAEAELQQAHAELEDKVQERTKQLQATVTALENEMQTRRELESQLRQWSRVFMDAADPIVIEDMSGTIIDMNREAEREYGWQRQALIGKSILSLIPSDRHPWADRLRARCRSGKEIRNWEGMRQDQRGRIFSVLLTAFPLLDDDGNIIALATIAKDISLRKQMETELETSQKHLRELSRKSIEALESDRRTTAKELHDSIGASLAAIKFRLEAIAEDIVQKPQKAAASLGEAISYLQATIQDTKQISAKLRPTILDDLGLISTITWYTRQFSKQFGNIQLKPQIEIQEENIPETLKIVIYRVLQEALHNAGKHSEATEIAVALKNDAHRIVLEIADNGRGFDVQKTLGWQDPLSGYGLANMIERAEIVGGSLTIDSSPREGSHIKMMLPLSSPFVSETHSTPTEQN